jgi:NTE family protein
VTDRQKDIAYASHIRRHIENFRALHDLRRSVNALATRLPPAASQDPDLQRLIAMGCTTTMNIVHLLYRSRKYDTGAKDYEFSRASCRRHGA